MTIQNLPHAHQIRLESRLQPSMVNREIGDSTSALEVVIESRIEQYRAVIAGKLANVPDTADNQTKATLALSKRVEASLNDSAGNYERAGVLKAESADILDDLVGTSPDDVAAEDEANGGSNSAGTVSLSRYRYDETLQAWVASV